MGGNGLRVTKNDLSDDQGPEICTDGAGGVIVTWYSDNSTTKNIQSYAQRYNSAGVAQWGANGVQVCTAAGFRGANGITPDGSNGVIIFFLDSRNDAHGTDYDYFNSDNDNSILNADIYAQRLNGSGSRLWANNGVAVSTAAGNQQVAGDVIADGNGGAIVLIDDGRNDNNTYTNYDVYAQRVNSSGTSLWAANGVTLSAAAGNQNIVTGVSDGAGGVVAAFKYEDSRLYAQRITGAGATSWVAGGIAISNATDNVMGASLINDGSNNTIITYDRNGNDASSVQAQKLNAAGAFQWSANGAVITNTGFPYNPRIVKSDNGSAIIAWNNSLGASAEDTYASKILTNGVLAGGAVSTYVTTANGNWSNPATWLGGVVPPAGADVTIHHVVSCNVNTSCASLKVEQPAGNLTVLTGFKITITQ